MSHDRYHMSCDLVNVDQSQSRFGCNTAQPLWAQLKYDIRKISKFSLMEQLKINIRSGPG